MSNETTDISVSMPLDGVWGDPLGVATWRMTDVTATESGGYAGWVVPGSSEDVWQPLDARE